MLLLYFIEVSLFHSQPLSLGSTLCKRNSGREDIYYMMHESTIVYCLQSDMTRVEYKLTPSLREWLWFVHETWVSPTGRERGTPRKPFTQAVFTEPTAKHAS